MRIHESVTKMRILDAVNRRRIMLEDPGFCVRCGAEAEGVEPDACAYECEVCGEPSVYGAEELLLTIPLA